MKARLRRSWQFLKDGDDQKRVNPDGWRQKRVQPLIMSYLCLKEARNPDDFFRLAVLEQLLVRILRAVSRNP